MFIKIPNYLDWSLVCWLCDGGGVTFKRSIGCGEDVKRSTISSSVKSSTLEFISEINRVVIKQPKITYLLEIHANFFLFKLV